MKELMDFLDSSHSVYHAAAGLAQMLEDGGYEALQEGKSWCLAPGGKYYFVRGGTAVVAFRIPEKAPAGFLIGAAHSDRPTFKVKENGELSGAYTRLSTEKYGGMLISTWLDRPLSVAGRLTVKQEDGVKTVLVDIDRDLALIPNVAIHMNRKANEGYSWNPAVDTLPLIGGKEAAGALEAELRALAGGEILGRDLYLYLRQKASRWGAKGEFISAQALDDLMCAYACTRGFLQAGEGGSLPVLCIFDSEEVGSSSYQGAASGMLSSTLRRICTGLGYDEAALLANSFMVSADNAHALHPNHPELADSANAPVMNECVVLKFNANQRYTTDGVSAGIWREICQKAQVPVQTYCNRADIPGGSTLGCISLSQVSVPCVDVGLPQLAMHSAYETAGFQDAGYLIKAMQTYYGCTLAQTGDGYLLKIDN